MVKHWYIYKPDGSKRELWETVVLSTQCAGAYHPVMDGVGDGVGDGHGIGHGYGYGDGDGYGHGHGIGDGDGYGHGHGYGYGVGYGHGDGHGIGDGNSDGDDWMKFREGEPVVLVTGGPRPPTIAFGYFVSREGPFQDGLSLVTLTKVRQAVFFGRMSHGYVGLGARGPSQDSRITEPADEAEIGSVAHIMRASPEAVRLWEKGFWSE